MPPSSPYCLSSGLNKVLITSHPMKGLRNYQLDLFHRLSFEFQRILVLQPEFSIMKKLLNCRSTIHDVILPLRALSVPSPPSAIPSIHFFSQ